MTALRKFFALPLRKKGLVLTAWTMIFTVRVGLWVLPFPRLLRLATFLSREGRPKRVGAFSPDESVWAVRASAKYVPNSTCLTRALALNALLARQGHTSHIKIGVAKDAKGGFKSHAWVEKDGRIILGYLHDLDEYSTFVSLEQATNLLDGGFTS